MPQAENDIEVWTAFKKTVLPLVKKEDLEQPQIPPRLRVYAAPTRVLQNTLDLHGLTVQEAYESVKRFFILHQNAASRVICIITGKGLKGQGLIKNEILFWFETPFFKEKISSFKWINDGGTLRIQLKRKKEKCRKK